MKITVMSIFDPQKIELETQSTTLGVLLDELSENQMLMTEQFYDSYLGEIYPDCELVINKCVSADGLNTRLRDGDRVEIYLVTPGGG